jgi:hypothetical protein
MNAFDPSVPPPDVSATTVRLRRNPGHGWIDLILEAANPAEADRLLAEEAEALRQRWQEDMTLHEALEIQRLSDELERLRADLRRAQQMRRGEPPAPPEQPDSPEPAPELPRDESSAGRTSSGDPNEPSGPFAHQENRPDPDLLSLSRLCGRLRAHGRQRGEQRIAV